MSFQICNFIVSIILARLLEPSVYGSIALVLVFTTILNVFVDSGFGSALIQKKDADHLDFSTVFYFNMLMCLVLYGGIFLCAPAIANFYEDEQLTNVIRVLSLTIVFSGLKCVQQAYVSKNLLFKKMFYANSCATVIASIIGIWMAYSGFGIWSLVTQQVSSVFIGMILLWIFVKWKPYAEFSIKRLKKLYSFGWKLLVSSLLDTLYNQFNQFIIGKVYTTQDLAFYNRGQTFPSVIVENIDASINSVLFPTLSAAQDNVKRVKEMASRAIKTSTYFITPLVFGLAATADTLVPVLLTDKWTSCIFFLRIFCFTYLFYPIHTVNLNSIKAIGRSDLFLRLEILKKIIGLTAILITVQISVQAMAISLLFTSVASQIINSFPNKKLLDYSYLQQLKDIFPQILLALFMGIIIFFFQYLTINRIVILLLQITCGAIIYIAGSKIFKLDSYQYSKKFIISYIKK